MLRASLSLFLITVAAAGGPAMAAEPIATLRGPSPMIEQPEPPRLTNYEDSDVRRSRNYPEQPPIIPHDIDGYRIDLNSNKCLSCHARSRVEESGAPMVSITHFMDREGQFRAAVTPRRYFCTQCHVGQLESEPIIGNTFVDIDSLLAEDAKAD